MPLKPRRSTPLQIRIFGNINNYPLLLAEGFRALGHNAVLLVNRREMLHRPEGRRAEWAGAYPDWILDCSELTEDDIACNTSKLDNLLHLLTDDVDLAVLNDFGPALAGHLRCPHVSFLTGSDLTFYASHASIDSRTASWMQTFRSSVQGRRSVSRMMALLDMQRSGISASKLVLFGLPGLIPEADRLLEALGVGADRRMMLMLSNVGDLAPAVRTDRYKAEGPLRVVSGCRIVYRQEANPGLGPQDFKGTDILIKGLATFVERGGDVELVLPRKGQDVDAAAELVSSLGLSRFVRWVPEGTLAEFYRLIAAADVVCDQFGISFPGMVTTDAFALGKPVLANLRPDVFGPSEFGTLPGLHAETPEQIAAGLAQLSRETFRRSMGEQCRTYAERNLAPAALASRLLTRLGL